MDRDENKTNEEKVVIGPEDIKDSVASPVGSLPACSGLSDECSIETSQNETTSKKISRQPESDGLPSTSDELPVKRIKIDKTDDDEIFPENVNETIGPPRDFHLNDSKPAAGKVTSKSNYLHKVKWVEWGGNHFPIITQNENGPCPLIAIVNILLLRKKVSLTDGTTEISAEKLVEHVRAALDSTVPKDCDPNHFQNMQDALAVLPQLQTGLDVNVKFTGVKNFEYTTECIIFDLLNIHLYHGWLLDPQSAEVVSAVGNASYNQLVEMIINKKTSKDMMERNQAEAAEQFLEATSNQLTCYGLCELNASMESGEMAVLFRNNHFSVIYKHKENLYQLVTDQGFLEEKRVVWETLSTIFGDETFLDGNFHCLLPNESASTSRHVDEQQQLQDYLMALSLQDEQDRQQDNECAWETYDNELGPMGITTDEELAKRLYMEEQRMAQVSVSSARMNLNTQTERAESSDRRGSPVFHQQQSAPPAPKENEDNSKSKEWKCTIS